MRQVQRTSKARRAPEASRLPEALRILERHRRYAQAAGASPWQYAILISTLEAAALTRADMRWLLEQGYLKHAVDCTRRGQQQRRFRKPARGPFDPRTCFILTEAGARLTDQTLVGGKQSNSATTERPRWDAERRELRLGEVVVKRFRVPAPNQSRILDAFEEEGWPERIYDPLPPHPGRDSRRRLHDAIKKLNQGQLVSWFRFHGDGTGEGICWEMKKS